MPAATHTKAAMAGTKRKSDSGKESHVKGAKKPKVDIAVRPKATTKTKPHVKSVKVAKVAKVELPPLEDSSDQDLGPEDGGVPLHGSESDSDGTPAPKAQDGVHPDRIKAAANGAGPNGTSSKEAHAKQKQLVAERKASKPLAEQLARTKKIWERLRRKSHVPLEERKQLVDELFGIITGRIKDYVLKHDSVRVVQTAIKYANLEQKRLIARELQGSYRQLAESRYAKFLIGKLLVQDDDEIRDLIVPEFFGNVRRLIKHPEASWILDDVYRGVATGQQKAIILREWYGAEFALFQKDNKDKVSGELKDILAEDPGKRAPIMRSLQELINHLIQKKMTGFTLLHDAMLQYFLNAKPGTEEITDYLELIKGDEEGDLLKNLAFTKPGSRVVCLALAYGTAKDRKHILKTYKDTLQLMAGDPNGHIIILTAYEVIDDTVLTSKSIFPELLGKDAEKQLENIAFMANSLSARTTLLYLYQGRSRALFPLNLFSDLEILTEIDTIRTSTSKKDPKIRRQELAKALSPFLLTGIASSAADLVTTSFGCQFVTEVLFGAEGDKSAALEAVALTAAGDPSIIAPDAVVEEQEGDAMDTHELPQAHIATTAYGGKMLRALIAGGRFDNTLKKVVPVSPPLDFANILFPSIAEHVVAWATGSSSFVVVALLESDNFTEKSTMVGSLKKEKKVLMKAATEETVEQAAKGVEVAAGGENKASVKKGKKKQKSGKEMEIGNTGTKMVLKLLD